MMAMTAADIRDRLIAQRVIPVLRLGSAESAAHAVDCLMQAGYSAIEITLTVPGAVMLIEDLTRRMGTSCLVGAGTVLDLIAARQCIEAGAKFLVSPCLVPGMTTMAHAAGCASLPGGYTPGEVLAAHREGADIVKIFPATSGGPEHLRAIHAVFPHIALCPTGGVSLQNIDAYFAAGAALVGVGNNIIDQQALDAGDPARATAHARRFLERGQEP